MSYKKHAQTPEYQWEQALLDACNDYCWRQTLEPLDVAWFHAWVKDNPPPAGYKLG